jgi:hypothetical protein
MAGKVTVSEVGKRQQSAGKVITYEAVGLVTLYVMGSRKTGRAEYALLRWYNGGEARKADCEEKNANTDVCVFFYLSAPDHGEGAAPPPLSRGRTGLRPERSEAEWREQTHPIVF